MIMTISSRAAYAYISNGLHSVAIAQVVLFSIILAVQFPMRYMQEWRYWHHSKRQSHARCALYSWWSMIGLLCMIRIIGSAMVIATSEPTESMLTAELSLQSVGLSPLFFEVSLLLLRCGQAGQDGPGDSKYPKALRITLHAFRLPIIISIVLGVVGKIIDMKALGEAGSILLIVTFAVVCGIVSWLVVKSRSMLSVEGHRAVLLVALALPFLLIRVIYFILQEIGPAKFSLASGDVGILAGMGLVMEVIIVSLLVTARAVAEPIWSTEKNISDGMERA
ncbi:uncharacterized protein N7483_000496 [Penicillium malachiteum]|uniref:uncharacterized protein n=1 Tax=Penicillium malachiteum TaxID=1324776 RepID=UPI00254686D1|nr:uncharacterized protein N7483_000496 [Penicillium malachiteum]KAJ5735371.1 hypothetical protein N7483_000496 [Penicillium malachiteum]